VKFIRKSLSAQLLTGLLAFSIVSAAIIGIIAYNSGRQSIITNVQTHLKSVAILKKQAIDKWTEHLQHSLTWIANQPQVIRDTYTVSHTSASQDAHKAACQSLTAEFNRLVSLGHVSQVFLIDKLSGQIIASSNPFWVGKFRENELFFIQGKEGFYISDIFLSLSLGRPTMVISGPVIAKQGNLLGVLAAHADFEQLSAIMLARTGLSKTTETFLVNKSNLLITNTVFAPNGAFKKWIFGQGAKWALAGQSGVDLFQDYRDVAVIGAFLWLPDRKLALIAKQDAAEAFAPIAVLGRKILVIGIGVCLLVLFAGFVFARRITNPLQKLVKGAQAIGQGDLDYRVGISAQDEIGALSSAFDQMAANLKTITVSHDEKEVLLREIHHRVKNNLQLIQSLLNLQMDQVTNEKLAAPLRDSKNRISSIAMVHETLYKSKDLSIIDLNSYFQELANYLFKSLRPSESDIKMTCTIEQMPMDLDIVVACGLIINELVTNALKYAFVKNRPGRINIDLHRFNKTDALLMVSDDGVGMAPPQQIQDKGSLGLELVHILAQKQLEGSINIDQESGLKYQIQFPIKTIKKESVA